MTNRKHTKPCANWVRWAIQQIHADFTRSSDTHLLKPMFPILQMHDIHLYLKDESTHPTGSLKHRLARSLFLYAICNGWIGEGTTIVEASSGSTAISEAYFARLLNLPFIAVIPEKTAAQKVRDIEFWGGRCERVPPGSIYRAAEELARERNGHYMDQFTYAERATDWRGNNNIAQSIFDQMKQELYPNPEYIVMSAGTGGTSATIGRYLRYALECEGMTRLILADPENSVFYDYFHSRDRSLKIETASRIEGIGRPRVEPSLIPDVIHDAVQVQDNESIATTRFLERYLGKKVGASTGTNVFAAFRLISQMLQEGRAGSVVTLICDAGDRYKDRYFNDEWLQQEGLDLKVPLEQLERFVSVGNL
ncbi:MAG: PLP-dependent cysteine synthase family protein [Myxococcales bacterium]|nr:PLP-dependent cysteine synthase family protein [Myxococcales bacterium]